MAITTNTNKHLRSTEKRTVVQVANYFKKKKPMESIIRSTAEATGVSRRTVFRIQKDLKETGKLASPKRPKRGPYNRIYSYDEMVIRNKVHKFYNHRRTLPTLNTLLRALREDIKFTGSSWLLRKTLRKLGFT